MAGDSKAQRRYHTIVERSLSLFDPSSEWADYIAFLGRLAKAISTGKPEGATEIPLKTSIAKCLSRCLQPTLPSGVHQKALEVYDLIFSIAGVDGLSEDLPLYLPGLSHTLAFANLSTRPMILGLYEDYVLQLPSKTLRPASKAIILSLLPALEEETSEDFERTMAVFDSLRKRFADDSQESFFWQTLFVASISSSNRRPGVLVYLTLQLPKLSHSTARDGLNQSDSFDYGLRPEAQVVVTPEPGLLVRCFATGLQDDQPLVQRGFLDLLVTHMPLNSPVFSRTAHTKDVDVLVRAASMVVLRRDMGLNRRLWAWFTGSDGKPAQMISSPTAEKTLILEQDYFTQFGLPPLVRSLQTMIDTVSKDPLEKARPFRVALSLMDRWEIGGPVVNTTFISLLRSLHTYQGSAPSQIAFDEVFRSANVFFDGVESRMVFEKLSELLQNNELSLLSFIIENFNFEDAELQSVYLPSLCVAIAKALLGQATIETDLASLLDDVLALLPLRNKTTQGKHEQNGIAEVSLLQTVAEVYLKSLKHQENLSDLMTLGTALERCIFYESDLSSLANLHFGEKLVQMLTLQLITTSKDFHVIATATRLASSLKVQDMQQHALSPELWSTMLDLLVRNLWSFLQPSTPQYHVTATEDIWRLHELSRELEIVESNILALILQTERHARGLQNEAVDRYAVFWTHSRSIKKFPEERVPDLLVRPLLYILDTIVLMDNNDPGRRWLLSLPTMSPVFHVVMDANQHNQQSIAVMLTRTDSMIRLLKSSSAHWNSFITSPEAQKLQKQCITLLKAEFSDKTPLKSRALSLLREIHSSESGTTLPEELSALLVEQLSSSAQSEAMKAAILDTLLAVLSENSVPPRTLLPTLLAGVSSSDSDILLEKHITLLCNSLPQYSILLPNLLKITETFCKRIKKGFEELQELYSGSSREVRPLYPERSVVNLLSGMEYILARAHQQVLARIDDESGGGAGPGADLAASRAFANDHLTVVLCMQDVVKICSELWFWRGPVRSSVAPRQASVLPDVKSFQYMALKLRSRSRRILENLIEAEPQECLETLVSMRVEKQQAQVLELLQTLDGARPKFMMPATFNAIYSRTNPTALDLSQKSSLSVDLRPLDLITFLNDYTSALEDDLLEEIWADCTTFLREVLANPMPHRQILVKLLEFNAVLCRKMENTNFGEALRMRRELADLCARLFTAIFTIKPAGFDGSSSVSDPSTSSKRPRSMSLRRESSNALQILCTTLPDLSGVLTQADRLPGVCNGIALNITGPVIHSRIFPENINLEFLDLMKWMTSSSATATKAWKKDMTDAFNNPRFFQSSPMLANSWLTLIRQLSLTEKGMMQELLNRLAAPAAAGLMFGVGATAARNEADRKTQLDLRRICFLLLSAEEDSFVPNLRQLLLKLEELTNATPESSPSSGTRGDVYLVLRTLLLTFSQEQLPSLWPLLDSELRDFCTDVLSKEPKLNKFSRLQGAKLLDLLLLLKPDEFQLHEWLFVNDTIDAVYPPNDSQSHAYADMIATHLHSTTNALEVSVSHQGHLQKPWLCNEQSRDAEKIDGLLSGFFSQLSIRMFEDIYTLRLVDLDSCREDLIADFFADGAAMST